MTSEELFSVFPRPWRLSEEELGVALCADGSEAFVVDTNRERTDEDVFALAELIVELVNGAEE